MHQVTRLFIDGAVPTQVQKKDIPEHATILSPKSSTEKDVPEYATILSPKSISQTTYQSVNSAKLHRVTRLFIDGAVPTQVQKRMFPNTQKI